MQRALPQQSSLGRVPFDELLRVCQYLDIRSLCRLALCCRGLGDAAAADPVWVTFAHSAVHTPKANDYLQLYTEGKQNAPNTSESEILVQTSDTGEALFSIFGSWRAVFIFLRKPPPVPPIGFSQEFIVVPIMLVLNTVDFVTDALMCAYFYRLHHNGWFAASLVTFFVGPTLLTAIQLTEAKRTREPRTCSAQLPPAILNYLQLRMQYESFVYLIGVLRRSRLTGKQVAHHKLEWEGTQKKRAEMVHLVKLVEAVFESMPQSVLQLAYVFIQREYTAMALCSIFLSVLSVSCAVSFLEPVKNCKQVIARFTAISSGCICRAVAAAMFASSFGPFVGLPLGLAFIAYSILITEAKDSWFVRFLLAGGNLLLPFVERTTNDRGNAAIIVLSFVVTVSMTAASLIADNKQSGFFGKLAIQLVAHAVSAASGVLFHLNAWPYLGS
eukprot:TRINITY_DN9803_c0_g2_i1.p1 TRINITY_DN9803_c0_g2~~TRINITY_DN9803_c0_g2_i1.p1  ORF type:complete len:451 (+),score=62.60 TRINITY_DN9803_c0_g2_i1:29-1354(+)